MAFKEQSTYSSVQLLTRIIRNITFIFLKIYIHFYNGKRPHSVLMNRTPDKFESKYFNNNNKKTNFETEH